MSSYYNEIDSYAAQWLRNLIAAGHIAPGDVDERSIEDVRPDDLRGYAQCHFFAGIGVWSHALRSAGWQDDRPVWTGSCPCQPFSAAGKGAGFDDERHLWPAWFHLIRECRPPVVFGEQVSAGIRHGWLDLVRADLENEGYACGHSVFGAHSVDAPHIRQRMFFVADADSWQRERIAVVRRNERDGQDAGRSKSVCCTPACREVGKLADADATGQRELGSSELFDGERAAQRDDADGRGTHGIVGHTDDARLEGRQLPGERAGERAARSAGVGGFWSGAEWIHCRDGKLRSIEPGTFPLAHGLPRGVGSLVPELRELARVAGLDAKSLAGAKAYRQHALRAYGNAIVAPAAEAFVRAYTGGAA